MFLSQKGSLGRNPMINRVGQRLLQLFEGASAAYSLRDLASNIASVVRVRRASDNSEKDFSAADVSSGAMTQWVNAQIVPPLDVRELVDGERTGALIPAAAAYSLRNLSTSYTGNVVDVRRSSDDAEDSFTAAQVADGTLTDFVNVGKDYVGYAAFQNSNTSNVNLSSSFTLEASESWSIKFGYIGGTTVTGLFGGSASNTGFWFANQNTIGLTDDSDSYQALSFGSALALKLGQHYEMEFFNTPSEGVRVTVDGVTMSTTPKIYGDITLNKIGVSRGRNGDRVIENVRIDLNGDGTLDYSYAGDGNQASNWTDRVGSNNGTPSAQVLTYNNEYTDGFVTQWYDQSGNANHATQGTDASQPKIVDAGSLVSGGIDFDGVDDTLTLSSPLGITSTASHFAVTNLNSTGTTDTFFDNRDSSTDGYSIRTNDASNINFDWLSSDAEVARVSGEGLYYFNKTSSQAQSGANGGTLVTASDSGSISVTTVPRIGARSFTSALNFFGGTINEFIIYGSDQSDNRTAFEANIGETYGIDLPSGVDTGYDQVDGFVETWYDQSSSVVTNYDPYPARPVSPSTGSHWNLIKTDNRNFRVVSTLGNDGETITKWVTISPDDLRMGKQRVSFDVTVNSGDISNFKLRLSHRDPQTNLQPIAGSNIFDVDISDNGLPDAPSIYFAFHEAGVYDVTISNLEVSHVTEPIVRNGNDAVQSVAGSQPKIVDAGVLVTGGIGFDGVDDGLDLPTVISSINAASSFVVAKTTNTSLTQSALALSRNAPELARFYSPIAIGGSFYFGYGSDTDAVNLGLADTSEHLFTATAGSSTAEGFIDGTSGGTVSSVDLYSQQALGGIGNINGTTEWVGQIQEIIIYDSDQSANRVAIETNINNQYDIY